MRTFVISIGGSLKELYLFLGLYSSRKASDHEKVLRIKHTISTWFVSKYFIPIFRINDTTTVQNKQYNMYLKYF